MNLHSNTNRFEPSESTIAPEVKSRRVIHSPLVLSIQWTVLVFRFQDIHSEHSSE